MNTIKQFLAAHNITAHSLAAVWLALSVAYAEVPQFHQDVTGLIAMLPARVIHYGATAVVLYAWYRNNRQQWSPAQRAQRLNGGANGGQAQSKGAGQ